MCVHVCKLAIVRVCMCHVCVRAGCLSVCVRVNVCVHVCDLGPGTFIL